MNVPYQYGVRLINHMRNHLKTQCAAWVLMAISLMLVACNSETDSTQQDSEQTGELVIGLTDAQGDFVTYSVDVVSLTLTKANGAVVDVLPLSTRVDFAQYVELTEFFTAAMVPHGAYVQASMTLDYSNADIWVEDANGDAVKVNTIQDADGNPVSTLEMSVRLEGRNKLVISRGVPAHLTLDFDLNASNQIVFNDAGEPVQTVEPYLIADVEMQRPKSHRVRGPLNDVNVERSQFEIIMRPFHHKHSDDRRFGTLRVTTTDDTVFDINDMSYQGVAGLEQMALLPKLTAVIAVGDVRVNPRRFVAREVYAGSSVPGGERDAVKGNVLARSGNTLLVKGATLMRRDGSVVFRDRVRVEISDATLVKKQLSMETHTIDEISVGQHVRISGTMTNNSIDALSMDATQGVVRMLVTSLRGTRVDDSTSASPSNYFVAAVRAINGRSIEMFDFSGTGQTVDMDADPSNYEIDTGALDLSDILFDMPIRVKGFVTPFGSAPADFAATTVVDLSKLPAVLTMNWTPDTTTPFTDVTENSFMLNLNGRGVFHHVGRGGAVVDLSSLDPAPTIMVNGDTEGLFILQFRGPKKAHTSFANFMQEIEEHLANGGGVKRLVAEGSFNDESATLNANVISVKLK